MKKFFEGGKSCGSKCKESATPIKDYLTLGSGRAAEMNRVDKQTVIELNPLGETIRLTGYVIIV